MSRRDEKGKKKTCSSLEEDNFDLAGLFPAFFSTSITAGKHLDLSALNPISPNCDALHALRTANAGIEETVRLRAWMSYQRGFLK
jgi:hypothetical protein